MAQSCRVCRQNKATSPPSWMVYFKRTCWCNKQKNPGKQWEALQIPWGGYLWYQCLRWLMLFWMFYGYLIWFMKTFLNHSKSFYPPHITLETRSLWSNSSQTHWDCLMDCCLLCVKIKIHLNRKRKLKTGNTQLKTSPVSWHRLKYFLSLCKEESTF